MRRLLLASIALSLTACSSAGVPDCPAGTTLQDDVCRTQCSNDEECAVNEECFLGLCVEPVGSSDAGPIDVGVIACTKDQECPNGRTGPWSDCVWDDDCDRAGRRTRLVRTGACNNGFCGINESPQMMVCPRDTNGMSCGAPQYGEFGPCETAIGDICTIEGMMSRSVDQPTCKDGTCGPVPGIDQQVCQRDTENLPCGERFVGPWSECMYADPCAFNGVRTRSIETFQCERGSCRSSTGVEFDMVFCTQQVADGTHCGTDAQCCAGACTSKSDPANCNACGHACVNSQCLSFLADDNTTEWACECQEHADCLLNYGFAAGCTSIGSSTNVCTCNCPNGDCTAQCAAGTCYEFNNGLNYCAY